MNLDAMTLTDLLRLNRVVSWELFTRIWWVLPIMFVIGVVAGYLWLKRWG